MYKLLRYTISSYISYQVINLSRNILMDTRVYHHCCHSVWDLWYFCTWSFCYKVHVFLAIWVRSTSICIFFILKIGSYKVLEEVLFCKDLLEGIWVLCQPEYCLLTIFMFLHCLYGLPQMFIFPPVLEKSCYWLNAFCPDGCRLLMALVRTIDFKLHYFQDNQAAQ